LFDVCAGINKVGHEVATLGAKVFSQPFDGSLTEVTLALAKIGPQSTLN
jgi:hypothetical protein